MLNYSVAAMVNPQDQDEKKYYARLQSSCTLDMMEFAEHIETHLGKYSAHEINAVLGSAVRCMREILLDGKAIILGDLGRFTLSVSSKGTEKAEDFTPARIYAVNVVWSPGEKFDNLLEAARFQVVPSRAAQRAVLQAEKSGASKVELKKAEGEQP